MLKTRFADWLEEKSGLGIITTTTVQNYNTFCADFLRQHGAAAVSEIDQKKITGWYIFRLKTCSASTIRTAHQILCGFFSWCVEQGDIPVSPMAKVKPPKKEKSERKALNEEEIKRLLDHVADKPLVGLVVRLALGTGLRRGELAALKWTDFDLSTGKLFVTRQIVKVSKCEIEVKPKTASGVRVISLPPSLVAELRVLSEGAEGSSPFTTSQGARPTLAHLSRLVGDAMSAVGLGDGYCLHSVRHSHATQLLRKKLPVKAVSQRLGHADITTTLRTYAHVFAADDAELADAVEEFICAPTVLA